MDKGPNIMERGRGVRLRDRSGRELVDCSGGLWCVDIGYGGQEIAEAAKQAILDLIISIYLARPQMSPRFAWPTSSESSASAYRRRAFV